MCKIKAGLLMMSSLLLSTSGLLYGYNRDFSQLRESGRGLTIDTKDYEEVKRIAETWERAYAKDNPEIYDDSIIIQRSSIQVGVDNAGQPIILTFLEAGERSNGKINRKGRKGTIICADEYLGGLAYKTLGKKAAKKGFYVVAFDPIGTGQSSYNDPVAMDGIPVVDGIGTYTGYSVYQQTYLYHEAVVALGINPNTAETPIAFTSVDPQGPEGVAYASLYANDPYSLAFLILENAAMLPLISSDPCIPSVFNEEEAQYFAGQYAADPCGTICFLYNTAAVSAGLPATFTEVNCPDYGTYLLNQCVKYTALTPAAIFSRKITQTTTDNVFGLMAGINIPVLMLNSNLYQTLANKQTHAVGLYGFCGGCEAGCTNATYILPFPNSWAIYYEKASLILHATRKKRFSKDFLEFVTGEGFECQPEPVNIDFGADCVPCPVVN